MSIIRFNTNVPIEVRLRDLQGATAPSNFGADQIRFDTDQGSFYVSESVGAILRDQFAHYRIKAGEPVEICKCEADIGRGRKAIRWEVSRVGVAPGEQADGSFAVDKPAKVEPPTPLESQLRASIDQAQARKPVTAAGEFTARLVAETNALVDAFALSLQHASRHGIAVKPEDVRSILLSAYINASKSGGQRAA